MKLTALSRAVLFAGAAFTIVFLVVSAPRAVAQPTPSPDLIARGAYLVGNAGQCSDCHGASLGGGPNMMAAPPGAPWAKTIPALRGLPMFKSDADAIAFLHTTHLPSGSGALPPMPKYQFNTADATAIVAYLRSLK